MATGYPQKSLRKFTKTSRYRNLIRQKSRKLNLEQLEDRRVMAVTGPSLVALATNVGDNLLSDTGVPLANVVLHTNPRELDFLFAQGQRIDPATLGGIRLVRGGLDGVIGTGDDVSIAPGYVGLLDDPRSVVMRFASALPDDAYRVTIVGSGSSALKDLQGAAFNGGVNKSISFRLNAGAQVQAVVPQPLTRDPNDPNGLRLLQASDSIEVYFNNDQLRATPGLAGNVTNPAFYQLINTATQDIALPISVTYLFNATTATNQATLRFATPLAKGTYKLQVGTVVSPSNTLATAIHEAGPIVGAGVVHSYIGDNPTPGAAQFNDVDLYRFDLAVAGNFTATLTSNGVLNGALRIFNSAGAPIGTVIDATGAGGLEIRPASPLAVGTYYVGVSSSGNTAYNAVTGAGAALGGSTGAYTLSVDFAIPSPLSDQTSFADATVRANVGILGQAGLTISGAINTLPYNLIWPGASDIPGHRDIPDESHLIYGPAISTSSVTVYAYNFHDVYGQDPQTGLDLQNAITENQKQRTREILDLYSRYAGVQFVETSNQGFIVATGDLRAVSPTVPTGGNPAGIAVPGSIALMNAGVNWGNSQYGDQWFQTAMHEIGHVLGLDHSYDLPPLTIQGSGETLGAQGGEPVFPGDHDIAHIQALYRPASRDIDLYKFTLAEAGQWTAETVAERALPNTSQLDSVITVYKETQDPGTGALIRTLIARNDDYYGKDSFVDLHLEAGTYYVAVTSKGNTDFDPTVPDTGMGGTTEGAFQLKLNFKPDGRYSSVQDVFGSAVDGDADGRPGGTYEFFFQAGPTIFVDKANTQTSPNGSLLNPYPTISAALAEAPAALAAQGAGGVQLIRIVGNGGTDKNLATTANNLPYLVGFNFNNSPLADGQDFLVPRGVTVMVDAGAILKFRKANIDVGSSVQGVDRSHAAIQVLGTPTNPAYLTSFNNDALGGNSNGTPAAGAGDWGGIVMRADSDYDHQTNPLYLNYVNHAAMTYGGGKVVVNSVESVYNPLHMVSSRPNLSFNTITLSADAAISADPNSFDDSLGRLGPNLNANLFTNNSLNGLLVRIRTQFGNPVDVLTLNGRFHETDIVYVVPEDLYLNGAPGGPISAGGALVARPSARLRIDPGVVVKLSNSRIEARIGSQLIAEGTSADPVIFTALADNRFGGGGTFRTQNAGNPIPTPFVPTGLWSGLFFGPNTHGSIDNAQIYFAGGTSPIEGGFASFSPIEIYQGDVRIANSLFQYNQDGQGSQGPDGIRNGRGSNITTGGATVFVRGAQPIIVNNIIRDNAGQVMSINANAMQAVVQDDIGRSTDLLANFPQFGDNAGPLVRLNRFKNNGTNGMEVRGATLTTATVWDDTDIAHILRQEIIAPNFHTAGGLTLKSAPNESLVVKALGATAGLTASGTLLDINDRIGGALYILGQPGRPVIMTSLNDDTVSAGLDPDGFPIFDTNNDGVAGGPGGNSGSGSLPIFPPATGPLQVTANNNAQQLLNAMLLRTLPTGVTVSNPIYTGAATAAGTYINGDSVPLEVAPRGIVLSTGNAVIPASNTSTGFTANNNQPGDADLQGLVGTQFNVLDAASLTFSITVDPNSPIRSGAITFQFGSEEYDEFVGSPFNDVLGGFINGGSATNFIRDSAGNLVTINTGFFNIYNLAGGLNVEFDGLTSGLTATFPLNPGVNVLKLAVGDGSDRALDSAAFLTDLRFSTQNVGTGGIGALAGAGDWRGIKLDQYSNDRNVTTVYETENVYAGNLSLHGDPQNAQFIGNLAPDLKSGDDNRKLGFEVHGNISLNNPQNVDVYSFTADSGTEVWVNLDNTSYALQGIVELVDANGATIARSVVRSPDHNETLVNKLTGLAADMTKDVQDTAVGPQFLDGYAGRNYFSLNSVDPGFRVVLPGNNLKQTTYFIRVRSQGAADGSQDNDITKGLTSGHYQLNVRLRQKDEIPGTQIRYSNIAFATIGIDVQGMPLHSFLAGESTDGGAVNNSFATAQPLGNLLTSDRNTISVSGNIPNPGLGSDVQWYTFNLDYDLIQSIAGVNSGGKTWATIFDIDYANGLARTDVTLSVFDEQGRLIFMGRDGSVDADQPAAGQGTDLDDMSRGSVGVLDPFIGSAQLPTGTPGQITRYYVAVSSNRALPTAMDGTFRPVATSPLLRLEPVDSMRRIIEDHVGSQGGSTAAPPDGVAFANVNTVAGLTQSIAPYNLSDVQLYVHSGDTLDIVDPYAPSPNANHPTISFGSGNAFNSIGDIVYRSDAVLFGVQNLPGVQNTAGRLVTIDPATGAITVIGNDNIPNYDPNANPPNREQVTTDRITAMAMQGNMYPVNVQGASLNSAITLYYAVPDQFTSNVSRLYRARPSDGNAALVQNEPWGRVGSLITDSNSAAAFTDFQTGPVSNVTFTATSPGPQGSGIRIFFVKVSDPNKPQAAITNVTLVPQASRSITIEINAFARQASRSTNFNLPNITATFIAVAPGTLGNGISINFVKQDLGPDTPPDIQVNGRNITITLNTNLSANLLANSPTTLQELIDTFNANSAASALVTATFTGTATTDITQQSTTAYSNPLVFSNGRDPATAQDVADAVNNPAIPTAVQLISGATAGGTNPNGNITVADTSNYSPIITAAGVGGIVGETTGMAFSNTGALFGVSSSGAFYQINQGTARAINAVLIPGSPSFNGLTKGPQNLYNGAYKDLFFASTSNGLVYAINQAGQVQTVFGAFDAVDPIPTATTVNTGVTSGSAINGGLAFSLLDFNLFHPTLTRRGDAGHGLNAAPDNSRLNTVEGGTSIHFGLEQWLPAGNGTTYTLPTGSPANAQYGILTASYHADLTSNPAIGNNYNIPGGAKGNIITESFSLQGYAASLKPTLYFNYLQDSPHNVWVSISTDNGATWQPIAGNGDGTTRAQFVGRYLSNISPSINDPKPAFISASITDAPNNPYQDVQHLWDDNTWRQARIDLSEYANLPNLRVQFNFSTLSNGFYTNNGLTNLDREGFYLDDIIVGFAGRGEMVTAASPNVTDFFTTPAPVNEVGRPPPPSQVLNGPYQLEIRRGTEYGATLNPLTPRVTLFETYDPRDNFVEDDRDIINDGFEPGGFNLPFVNNSSSPWTVTNTANSTGKYSARAGIANASPSQNSDLTLTVKTGTGQVSFARKVSSHVGSGTLRFYIDGVLRDQWSGDLDFDTFSYAVTPGTHTFRWSYQKDAADSPSVGISDTAWIDDVRYQAPNVDFEPGAGALPAIFHTSTTPDANDHFYGAPPGVGVPFNRLPLGEGPWFVTNTAANTGTGSARSAVIPANTRSDLTAVKKTGEGVMQFAYQVLGNGTLEFFVDGVSQFTATATTWTTTNVALTAGYHTFLWRYSTGATVAATDAAFLDDIVFPTPNIGTGSIGDQNQYREQGSIVIEANKITHAAEIGIAVHSGPRGGGGSLPYPSSVIFGPTLNNARLVDGVVLVNNVVANYGDVGILFAGDPNSGNAPAAAVPFGRIFNNTIYGGNSPNGIGIQVQNNAGPTLLNNIVANAETGISIDASSAPNTVVATTLYSNNNVNIVFPGGIQTNPIVINQTPGVVDPLFVNAQQQNFYLANGSRAIDSSVDKLDDRFNYVAVKNPLGIGESPIIAPVTDLFGQLRQDDPANDPTGGGANIFKDLGAIDRVDFEKPTARLVTPLDNDPPGLDLDPTADTVLLNNATLNSFEIQLSDLGIGIDDAGIKSSQFVITANGVTQVDGVNYTFIYNANRDLVTFLPNAGVWPSNVQYVITLNNSVATGIKDVAGNTLLPNRTTGPLAGKTVFVIFVGTLYSFGTAPAPYPALLANDGARHIIASGMFLGTGIQARLDGAPTPAPNGENDGGITNFSLVSGFSSSFDVKASLPGKLDAWFDLNSNGIWETSEHVIVGQNIPAGTSTVNFLLPSSDARTTIARFRYSSDGVALPTGEAPDGEVGDYQVIINAPGFQNAINRLDVNGDGSVSPIDALRIINFINRFGSQPLPNPNALTAPDYLDTNGDGFVSPADSLAVVVFLNSNSPPPTGEGEGEGDGMAPASLRSFVASPKVTLDGVGSTGEEAIPAVIYANSSVVVEVKSPASSQDQVDDQLFGSGSSLLGDSFQPVIDELHPASRREQKVEARKLARRDDEQDAWDELLGDLAMDIGLRQES